MSPQSYLFHVNSGPVVSDELWREFYTSEHLPDIVNSGCAVRATFYEEIPTSSKAIDDRPRHFLALYQSKYPELMRTEDHHKVRVASDLFAKEGRDTNLILQNGDFDGRNYELIQEYDPKGFGETPPPQVLTVEIQPSNIEDFEQCYREEYLDSIQKLPGYRRSLRYKLGPDSGFAKGDSQPSYLAIHELDDLEAFDREDAEMIHDMPWTTKNIEESEVIVTRGWRLIQSLGY